MFDMSKHNYWKKVRKLFAEGKIPTSCLSAVDIYHDDWCAIHRGKHCNCDPDIVVRGEPRGELERD